MRSGDIIKVKILKTLESVTEPRHFYKMKLLCHMELNVGQSTQLRYACYDGCEE